MTARQAYKALPALRTSLKWYKREQVRLITRRIQECRSTAVRGLLMEKRTKMRKLHPSAFRQSYLSERIADIGQAPIWHLRTLLGAHRVHRLEIFSNG